MQSARGEEGMNLLPAVSNFSGLCSGEFWWLRHIAGIEGAPKRREHLQMSLLQNSDAVQMLSQHHRNPVSYILLYQGGFLLFHWSNNQGHPTQQWKLWLEEDTCASAAPARKVAEEKEWSSPCINHSIPPAQGFWSQLKAEQLLSILYYDHRCVSCIICFCSSFTS